MKSSAFYWIVPVVVAFVIHFIGSVFENFKEVQEKSVEHFKRNSVGAKIPDKIDIPDHVKNRYILKTVFFWICCLVVTSFALFSEGEDEKRYAVALSFGMALVIGIITIIFLFYHYCMNSEKVRSSNNVIVERIYNILPWLDEVAMAVVCGEFAFFLIETFHH